MSLAIGQVRDSACFEPFCIKIHAQVTSVGECGEKEFGVICQLFGQTFS